MELFRIGFISVSLVDIVDIAIVAFIFYKLYQVMRGTVAAQIFVGLLMILALSFMAQALGMRALGWLLGTLTNIWVIAFIVLFQPELRRLFFYFGKNSFVRFFIHIDISETVDEIADAVAELSKRQEGALIVIERGGALRAIVETGEEVRAKVSKELLIAIFNPKAPLHDGAVVIRGDIIEAARCTLPLSATTKIGGYVLGMRHRAGLGMSEQSDAMVVIVSEETGTISVAEDGTLNRGLPPEGLRRKLKEMLPAPSKGNKTVRSIFNFKQASEDA
jgi:diadenylate cyclase